MLKTVSYRTLWFPEYGMANASNFTRVFTPASNPERGNTIWATEVAFIYVKRPKPKNSVISYLRVPTVRNGQRKQFYGGFTPASNPERGNNTWATKWAFIYVKEPRLETVSYRTLGFGSQSKEWPMQAISREALPLPATPQGVTTYVQRNGLLFML